MLSDNLYDMETAVSVGQSQTSGISPAHLPYDTNYHALSPTVRTEECVLGTGQLVDQASNLQFNGELGTVAPGFDTTWQGAMRLLLERQLLSREDFSEVSAIEVIRV